MSFDIRVICRKTVALESLLTGPKWACDDDLWSHEARTWSLTVAVEQLDDEDRAAETALADAAMIVELSLSPISAPKSGVLLAARTARAICKAADGYVEEGAGAAPVVKKRATSLGQEQKPTVLRFAWWVDNESLRDERSLTQLVSIITERLPEALPRRYGAWEPAPHRLADTGAEHFVGFLLKTQWPVFVSSGPCADFDLDSWDVPGPKHSGFQANYLAIEIDSAAMLNPKWSHAARELWLTVAQHLRVFYAEVRTLEKSTDQNYVTRAPRWRWRGTPVAAPIAAFFGEPYRSLWPAAAERAGQHLVLGYENIAGGVPLPAEVWEAANGFFEPASDSGDEYAEIFPFERHPRLPERSIDIPVLLQCVESTSSVSKRPGGGGLHGFSALAPVPVAREWKKRQAKAFLASFIGSRRAVLETLLEFCQLEYSGQYSITQIEAAIRAAFSQEAIFPQLWIPDPREELFAKLARHRGETPPDPSWETSDWLSPVGRSVGAAVGILLATLLEGASHSLSWSVNDSRTAYIDQNLPALMGFNPAAPREPDAHLPFLTPIDRGRQILQTLLRPKRTGQDGIHPLAVEYERWRSRLPEFVLNGVA